MLAMQETSQPPRRLERRGRKYNSSDTYVHSYRNSLPDLLSVHLTSSFCSQVLCRKGDPYWRASTFLTRSGAVPQYGRAKWTYPRKEGTTDVEEWGLSDEEVLQKASKGPDGGVERAED